MLETVLFLAQFVRFPPDTNHSGHSPRDLTAHRKMCQLLVSFDLRWRLSEPLDTAEVQNAPPLKGERAVGLLCVFCLVIVLSPLFPLHIWSD